MKNHETVFHVINCHVPVCHAVVPSRKCSMWLFPYVIVISYKCSITSTEVAPLERQISAWEQVGNKQTWWEHGTTWEPRRSFIQLFFATIKNLGTKEEFFFNFGACSMKCDNLGENNAVKEFGEIEGTTCEPFFSAFGTNHSNAVT